MASLGGVGLDANTRRLFIDQLINSEMEDVLKNVLGNTGVNIVDIDSILAHIKVKLETSNYDATTLYIGVLDLWKKQYSPAQICNFIKTS